MLELLIAILMSLTGYSEGDVIAKGPENFGAQYDVAKQMANEQLADKEGGAGDTLSGN